MKYVVIAAIVVLMCSNVDASVVVRPKVKVAEWAAIFTEEVEMDTVVVYHMWWYTVYVEVTPRYIVVTIRKVVHPKVRSVPTMRRMRRITSIIGG